MYMKAAVANLEGMRKVWFYRWNGHTEAGNERSSGITSYTV